MEGISARRNFKSLFSAKNTLFFIKSRKRALFKRVQKIHQAPVRLSGEMGTRKSRLFGAKYRKYQIFEKNDYF
jgi:hypothetical protein